MKSWFKTFAVSLCVLGVATMTTHCKKTNSKTPKTDKRTQPRTVANKKQTPAVKPRAAAGKSKSLYSFTVKDIDGKDVKLSTFKGKVALVVNTASQCGYTPQYGGLQKLYTKYKDKGLVVLGFPANNFGGQEPGSEKQIKAFCTSKFHVTFPMFSKISVLGKDIHPLYKYLITKTGGADVSWNFNKFLVNRKGEVVARFESSDTPMGDKITKAVQKNL